MVPVSATTAPCPLSRQVGDDPGVPFWDCWESKKWNVRKGALDAVKEAAKKATRLAPADYGDLVRELKKVSVCGWGGGGGGVPRACVRARVFFFGGVITSARSAVAGGGGRLSLPPGTSVPQCTPL